MAQLFAPPYQNALDTNGAPISGGRLRFYVTGTLTPAAVYTTADLSVAHAAPVVADSAGRFPAIYLDPAIIYRVREFTAVDVLIRDTDPLTANSIANLNYTSSLTGGVARQLQDKLDETASLTDVGITGSGADETAAVVAKLTALASYQGVINAPMGVRMDLQQVVNAIPDDAVMSGVTVFQTGSGYRQQLIWDADNPPDANTDTARAIISTHYPDLVLNNLRTAGTVSAGDGLSGFSWARGFYRNGSKGPRFQWQANFTKAPVRGTEYTNKGVGCFIMRTRAPERAGNYEDWFSGIVVAVDDYILATNGYYYRATSAGTSTVSPTHTTGSVTTGGITWAFESSFVPFGVVLYVDELGRFGNRPCGTGFTQEWEQNPEDGEDFIMRWSGGGNSKAIRMLYRPTNGAGVQTLQPFVDVSVSGGYRMLDSVGSRNLFKATDAAGFQLGVSGRTSATATDLDTTPTVANGGRLIITNSGATSISDFDGHLDTQEVELFFTNANTTLVHSAALILKGAINVNPVANSIIVITRNPTNTAWVEKSRNFA